MNIADLRKSYERDELDESASAAELYANPRHPYTRRLLTSVLAPEPGRRRVAFAWCALAFSVQGFVSWGLPLHVVESVVINRINERVEFLRLR